MPTSAKILSALLTLSLFVAACDPPEDVAEEAAVAATEEPEQPPTADDPADEEPEMPRAVETTVVDDEHLGVLPDGVGVPVGEEVESFTLRDHEGDEVALADLLEEQAVMLVFYRGGWCPFCNFQIRELTEAYDQFADRNVTPVAISVDLPDEGARTSAAYEIPFPVLSDPDLLAHQALRVINEMDADEVARLEGMGMDIQAHSGRDHNTVAIPGVFLIDEDAVVLWAHAHEDYRLRPSIEQLLAAIDDAMGN